MFAKRSRKSAIWVLLILSAFIFGGAAPLGAFSVDINNFGYGDDSNRFINYDFSAGGYSDNAITLPESAIQQRAEGETGTAYFWGQAPGIPPINVNLDATAHKAVVSPPMGETEGVAVMYAGPPEYIPAAGTGPTSVFYSLQLSNFNIDLTQQKAYRFELGLGRDETDPRGPYNQASISVAWVKGFFNGTVYDNAALVMQARVENSGLVLWESTPLVRTDLDPAQTSLVFDYSIFNGNYFFAAVGINEEAMHNFDDGHTLAEGQFLRFPDLYPFLWVAEESAATGDTVSFSGILKYYANSQPVMGSLIEMDGNPSINTLTNETGAFTLTGLPANTEFTVKMTLSGYVPTYTAVQLRPPGAAIVSARPFNLFTAAELNNWSGGSGRGVIRGRVLNGANPLAGYISGAVATYNSSQANTYRVKYENDLGALVDGPGTFANGKYYILDVQEGDRVTVFASQPNYTFSSGRTFMTHDGAMSQGTVSGAAVAGRAAVSGFVKDGSAVGIGNAIVEQVGATPVNATVSNSDGAFYLTVPQSTAVYFKFSKPTATTTLAPTYSAEITVAGATATIGDFNLFPATKLGAGTGNWNITPGTGIIRARVTDQAAVNLAGATVSYESSLGMTYQVCYDDACTGDLTTTQTDGRYIVRNVEPGDTVTVTAQKTGLTFNQRIFHTYGDSVHQGRITGQNLTADEQAIRDGLAAGVAAINGGNLAGFMAYVSESYLDDGETKTDFQNNVAGLIADGGQLSYVLGTITIEGSLATVPVTWTFTFPQGQEVDQETLIFRNESGTWRIYGNQNRHDVSVGSQHWAGGYHAGIWVEDHPGITAVTVTGTGIDGVLNLARHEGQGWWYEGGALALGIEIPGTPPAYTITVTDGLGTEVYNRTITSWVEQFATNLSPVGQAGGPIVFTWTGIPGATEYHVELSDANYNRLWNSYDNDGDPIPRTRPWAVYTGDPLVEGNTYRYWVIAGDENDNSSFAEGSFTYLGPEGISFTQRVTDSAGVGVQGVSVTLGNNPYPVPYAETDGSGNFTLSGAPQGSWFHVKMEKEGFRPTYTALMRSQTNLGGVTPFTLFTPANTSTWPVNFETKGVIATRVVDSNGNNISGVVITAQSTQHPGVPYIVTYRDESDNFGGSSTYSNGRFYVLNVDDGDIVTVTAAKSGYTFPQRFYLTHTAGISQGRIVGAPQAGTITFSATLNDAFGQPVVGATVQVAGNPSISTTTNSDGSFVLAGIPANTQFALMFSKDGYVTSYSALQQSDGNLTSIRPFILFSQANLTAWGITAGKGAITGRVTDAANLTTGYVSGATVSATGASKSYTVVYLNDDFSLASGVASTQANGRFLVIDVDDGDTVSVTASKPSWEFQTRLFRGYANSVSIGGINGTFILPRGDIDGNGAVDLADAILALKVIAGMQPAGIRPDYAASGTDVNGDGKIGLAEVIHTMQIIAGLRIPVLSQQAAVDGVNASLALFRETWNANEMDYDYLPFFHVNYLNDGLNRFQAVEQDMPPPGLVIDSYVVGSVLSFNAAQKIITAAIDYAGTYNGVPESGIDTETFIYDASSGRWLRYGNQRFGEFSVWPGKSRTMAVGGTSDQFLAHFHLKALKDMAMQVVVNGPAGWTQTFSNRQPWWDDPDFDAFLTSTGGMDVNITRTPQVGDVYTFTVYKPAGGPVTYTQTLQHVLSEAPTVTSPVGHSLAGLPGTTLNIAWTLPDPGIQMSHIRIEGHFNNTEINAVGEVASPTTGTIAIPANATSGYIDVRIHYMDEIFTNCRFDFGP